jgi:hypothetical protein
VTQITARDLAGMGCLVSSSLEKEIDSDLRAFWTSVSRNVAEYQREQGGVEGRLEEMNNYEDENEVMAD